MTNIRYNYDEDNEINIIRNPNGVYLIYNYNTINGVKELIGEYAYGRYNVIDKDLLSEMFFGVMKNDEEIKSLYLEFINYKLQHRLNLYLSISNSIKNI